MDHNRHKHGNHREERDPLARKPSLQEVVLSWKENPRHVVSYEGGCIGAHCSVLAYGLKNPLSKAGRNESQRDEESCQDEPSTIQIDTTETKIVGSKSLRSQGLLGGVEPDHESENHNVASCTGKADSCKFPRVVHPSSKDLIHDSKGIATQIGQYSRYG